MNCLCKCCSHGDKGLPAFKLLKPMPGLGAGAVFVWDAKDDIKGSIGHGCLKLAWLSGNCQHDWCAETHILPGQLVRDTEWFERIENDGRYHV